MITIAGRPNVGKSTLTNYLVGEKIAIVSNKPQTTRNRICGIVTKGQTQFVFVDTPGYHKARTKLGDYMVGIARDSIADVDLTILVVEPIASIGAQEEGLIEKIKASKCPAVLAINKIDTVEKDGLLEVIAAYSQTGVFEAIIPISAKTGDGVEDLLKICEKYAVESPFLFPEGETTDQPERQVMAEIIREKLLWNLDREVPHGTAVEITRFSEREK
jgi:GTP-binding protein Era